MNIYEAITTRRTIRKFNQEPVREEDLLKLVDCARLAPASYRYLEEQQHKRIVQS